MITENKKTIAEFDLNNYDSIIEFDVDTEGDDLFFKLNTSMHHYLGDSKFNEDSRKILLQKNALDKYLIEHDNDGSKLKVRVVFEEVEIQE